jgi:hypothetical protein
MSAGTAPTRMIPAGPDPQPASRGGVLVSESLTLPERVSIMDFSFLRPSLRVSLPLRHRRLVREDNVLQNLTAVLVGPG